MTKKAMIISSLCLACTLNKQGLGFAPDGSASCLPDEQIVSNTSVDGNPSVAVLTVDGNTIAPPDLSTTDRPTGYRIFDVKANSSDSENLNVESRPLDLKNDSPSVPDIRSQPDMATIILVDLNNDSPPSADISPDLTADLLSDYTDNPIPDSAIADSSTDRLMYRVSDLKLDLPTPDLTPTRPLGTLCGSNDECSSSFCTNGVCCNVASCFDTCVPNGITTCAPYNGFTCAPLGTCRGY